MKVLLLVRVARAFRFRRARFLDGLRSGPKYLGGECIDCHNADTQEGTVDLSRFNSLDDVDRDRALWKTVFDVVEAGQMPLADSGYELDETRREEVALVCSRGAVPRFQP